MSSDRRGEKSGVSLFRRGRSGGGGAGRTPRRRRGVRQIEFDNVDEGALTHQIGDWVESNRPHLGEILLELGSVDPDDLLSALQAQQEQPGDAKSRAQLGQILVQLGSINDVALAAALAHQFDVPLADLAQVRPEPAALERVERTSLASTRSFR